MSVGPRDLHTLHRYFLWADRMRLHFYQTLPPQGADFGTTAAAMFHQPYMSYWYAGTYVLIEGWQELGLSDETIDSLLGSPHVDTLRRYRNGAFHFQADYFDKRFQGFIGGDASAISIAALREAFSKWFLTCFAWLKEGGVVGPEGER